MDQWNDERCQEARGTVARSSLYKKKRSEDRLGVWLVAGFFIWQRSGSGRVRSNKGLRCLDLV
jgi:hypothetical protein